MPASSRTCARGEGYEGHGTLDGWEVGSVLATEVLAGMSAGMSSARLGDGSSGECMAYNRLISDTYWVKNRDSFSSAYL